MPSSPVHLLRRLALRAILAAGILAAAGARADGPIVEGTLPEDYLPGLKAILKAAMGQSPTMISQQLAIAQSQAQVIQADANMIPQASANAWDGIQDQRVSQSGQSGTTSQAKGLYYYASVSEPIFQWGALFNQSRLARIGVAVSKRQYAEAYRNLAVQIREGYLGLIVGKLNLRNARFNQELAEKALAVAEAQFKIGAIAPAAMSGPRLAVDDARLATDRGAEAYAHARRTLALMAGLEDIPDGSVPDSMPRPAYSEATAQALLAAFLRDGARSTFEAQVLQLGIDQARLNYDIHRVNLLPKFSLGADINLQSQSTVNAGQPGAPATVSQFALLTEQYQLQANWNIFDGFRTHGQLRSDLAARRSDERSLKTYVDTTLEQAQDLERQVGFSARALDLVEIRDGFAAENLVDTENDFKFGSAAQTNVDSAMLNRYGSEAGLAAARSDFLSRWCEFVSLVGADPLVNDLPLSHAHVSQ